MPLQLLEPLRLKTKSPLSLSEFHHTVNVVFHDIESRTYDELHQDMWMSLQPQFDLLVADVLQHAPIDKELRLLDIGSGTGLSSELLLKTQLGAHIKSVTLLDTSEEMLKKAQQRANGWGKEIHTHHGNLESLTGTFDVILICSVLHHIPELAQFLNKIDQLQPTGSILIHLQDPNGDAINDTELKSRTQEWKKRQLENRSTPDRTNFLFRLKKKVRHILGRNDYIGEINRELKKRNAIKRNMTAEEIWSVTDFHVENLPYSAGEGISLEFLKKQLSNYQLLQAHSYGFYGDLIHELPDDLALNEKKWSAQNAMNGRNLSAVWKKN